MSNSAIHGSLVSEFSIVPSNSIVIRRYMALEEDYIRNYFEKGPFCRHIPTFCDDNEGLLGEPGWSQELKAALAAASSRTRERTGGEVVSDEEFEESLKDFHEAVRHKHFANCWRLGTSESEDMWKDYIEDEDMVEGFAYETTVGQFVRALPREPTDSDFYDRPSADELHETEMRNMHVGATWSDIKTGAVRYQNREQSGTVQPAAYQASINFFKRKKFDYEKEFRLLINPFDSARLILSDRDATPLGQKPDVDTDHRFLPMDTTQMTNRIVLAPNADEEQRERIESVLDEVGIDHGSSQDNDLEIVESTINGPPSHEVNDYEAEFVGQDNYEGTQEYLNECLEHLLEETSDEWSTVDLVLLQMEKAGVMGEGYRYQTQEPEVSLSDYGHDEFQGIAASRQGDHIDGSSFYANERMEEMIEDSE